MAIYYQGIMVGPDFTCGLDSGTGWIVWECAWLLGVYVAPACLLAYLRFWVKELYFTEQGI